MKNIVIILFSIPLFIICSANKAQTESQVLLNKEYNQLTYVYKQIWNYLDEYKVANLNAYSNDGETIVKINLDPNLEQNRDSIMNVFMKQFYLQEKRLSYVRIGKKKIHINDCTIKIDRSTKIREFLDNHVRYCDSINDLSHNQGELTLDDRLEKFDITGTGSLAENCSMTTVNNSDYQNLKHVLVSYWKNRNITNHFFVAMMDWNYMSTSFSRDSIYFYSVTAYTSELIE